MDTGRTDARAWVHRLQFASRVVLLLILVLVLVAAGRTQAGGGPRDVIVVINANSSASREIGKYYQQARGIPDINICYLRCPDREAVTWRECESMIRRPIRRFLARPEIAGKVDYIVLTKGVPLMADYADPSGPLSIASVLLCPEETVEDVDRDGVPDGIAPYAFPYGPLSFATWHFVAPQKAWSHTLFDSNIPGDYYDIDRRYYLVTRLDAFTVGQVKALIDRSIHPARDGIFVLDRNTWITGAYKSANSRLGDQTGSAYYYLTADGFKVRYDAGQIFLANTRSLMGYFSWANHDAQYTFDKYTSNLFVAGSIGDTYYSYSGRTFNDPGTKSRSPLIADLLGLGLCGAGSYVSEPYITTATYPNVLFSRYIKGFNVAESFYAACPEVFWKTVVIGDPLMAPYASPPQVTLQLDAIELTETVTVRVSAWDESGIARVRFYLDDDLIGVCEQQPFEVELDTSRYPIGAHTIEAIAYENSNIATQGSDRAEVLIVNEVSNVAAVGDVLRYVDGQMVAFQDGIVTATAEEIGDSIFIEEPDRSTAIQAMSTTNTSRGDVVSVTGAVGTDDDGNRVIKDAVVTVTARGAAVPRPIMMGLRDLGGAGIGDYTPAVGSRGARNVSLLVKVIGRVVGEGDGKFYITDGSVSQPTAVICPGLKHPSPGSYVVVTGLSVAVAADDGYKAAVRARGQDDIAPIVE